MNAQAWMSIGCFLAAVISAANDIDAWIARLAAKRGGYISTKREVLRPLLWIAAPVIAAAIGGFLLAHHPAPKANQTASQIIEKAAPCSPSQSGAATTKGTQSPAITGSNNGVNYGQQPPQKKQQ